MGSPSNVISRKAYAYYRYLVQLDIHCYVINVIHETIKIGDIVTSLIEEATHSFTRLLR